MKGILFSQDMIKALLAGRKSQTRRIIKSKHESGLFRVIRRLSDGKIVDVTSVDWDEVPVDPSNDIKPIAQIGDILYVREAHYAFGQWHKNGLTKSGKQKWRFEVKRDGVDTSVQFLDNKPYDVQRNSYRSLAWYKRSSLFMFAEDARLFLEVTGVKVERACDISEEDAIAEGIQYVDSPPAGRFYRDYSADASGYGHPDHDFPSTSFPKPSFRSLFESINGPESWEKYCFCYSFKQIDKPVTI